MHPILRKVLRFLLVTIVALLLPLLIAWTGLSGFFLAAGNANAGASPFEWAWVVVVIVPAIWPPLIFIWLMAFTLPLGIWFWHIPLSALTLRWFTFWIGALLALFLITLIVTKITGANEYFNYTLF